FDNYINTKKELFDDLPSDSFALVNLDDKHAKVMLQNTKGHKHSYSLKHMSDFKAKVVENSFTGLLLHIDQNEVFCRLIGQFNASNILSAYSVAVLLGIDKVKALTAISNLKPVEGRFEVISSVNSIYGIVDYAHTPDALDNVLLTIEKLRTGNEQVISVVGCGGNRDKAKRPEMAKIACELSDRVVLTSDNPRTENAEVILDEMQKGVSAEHKRKVLRITDRAEAIKTACTLASPGDIILVAGKGHEKYQEINGVKYPFDDLFQLKESFRILQN
ncbi:MAG: UDP-N-acetylmuramyl-tripeptide synthetase, partial [Bacteroidia bacterium]|nr:UDP-N-acetylmuramyl-tripeptide synthetase [Bacteroidia bacterium]